jgi:hypothetical protein
LHALNSKPVRGPADAGREHEFLFAEHAFKVNFLVLNEINGANRCGLWERGRAAEDRSRVWAMTVEWFDVEDT